ncbi:hypothetical protein ES703_37588 [subsurface metagenome]
MLSFKILLISLSIMSTCSLSTKSIFVITTNSFSIFKSLNISRCSIVWGIIPSSAATTKSPISIPDAPAIMFFTNFSCPGTSIIPTIPPDGKIKGAKPISIDIPLSFSSFSLSVSTPVICFISTVFPWFI